MAGAALCLAVAQLTLAACAATARGTVQAPTALPGGIAPSSTVTLDISSDMSTFSTDIAARLRERLHGALVADGLVTQVLAPADSADYSLSITLTEVKQEFTAAHPPYGSMAGRIRIVAALRLSKAGADAPVLAFKVTGESAVQPGSADSSMDEAVRLLGQKVVKGLKGQ